MCAYPQSDIALLHWKCVLKCCAKYPCVNLPDQETDDQYSETTPLTQFHIYHLILQCTAHERTPLNDRKLFFLCKHDCTSEKSTKKYIKKELVIMETKIYNFHTSFYIPAIWKLSFHLTHVQILGKNHCGDSR